MTKSLFVVIAVIASAAVYSHQQKAERITACEDQVLEVMKNGPTTVRDYGPSAGVLVMVRNICSNQ